MRNLVDLLSMKKEEIFEIFDIADKIQEGELKGFLNGKSIVLFFPNTSIRTRVTFEKGIYTAWWETNIISNRNPG